MSSRPLIFIHIPKTAGTSFITAVKQSAMRSIFDYGIDSPSTSPEVVESIYRSNCVPLLIEFIKENNVQFLAGHEVYKYINSLVSIGRLCTIFRNPVQRVVSEYNHFVKHYKYTSSIQTFIADPNIRNRQFKLMGGLELDQLYFFGFTEDYKYSLRLFNILGGFDLPNLIDNVGRQNLDDTWVVDDDILDLIKYYNEQDMLLYVQAKKLFNEKWGDLIN